MSSIGEKYKTPKIHLDVIKTILKLVTDTLEKENITYFIDGGTLLGAIRHNDIIPHDDDADIGVFDKDFTLKLPKLFDILKEKYILIYGKKHDILIHQDGLNLIKVYIGGLWVFCKDNERIVGTPTIDIFRWEYKSDKIRLCGINNRILYKNCFYTKKEMFPLKKYKFGDLDLFGANNGLNYLKRYYGNDCLKIAKIEIRIPTNDFTTKKDTKTINFEINNHQDDENKKYTDNLN